MINLVKDFTSQDSGAVTVDWVVLTGSVTGLGLAVVGTVSAGIEDLSSDIANTMAGISTTITELASNSFSGGAMGGWIGGTVMDMGGDMGEVLVLGPGEATNFLLDVPTGAQSAEMVFDLIAGDSLDNTAQWGSDTATVMVNGVPVAIATNTSGSQLTFDIPQTDGTTVEATVTVEPTNYGGRGWSDTEAQVTITVDQPTGPIELEIVSNANQGINDEFWAIDEFSGSATQ